ncbi:hypothetical protein WR25_05123 isoform B [Diploscapter pachys]|uniref:Amiloride-sensitive sodium channel n=1 Tax=Diploscapter pachys TaxID=2018661 RepID=A0A2A2KIT5_9BILA|nr:hypothetical protein WR25_05123 isoform A [Diploscapter pachys]PAV73817.1 hypothetical protein WR25_05123 isoform B [Diploscapter pachys]
MPNPTHPTVDDSHRQPMERTSEGRNGNRDGQFRAQTTDRISCDGSDKARGMRLFRSFRSKRKSRSPHESTSDQSCSEQDDNLRIFSETTTLHGLRDVILSTSNCLKIVWAIILFFALLLTLQGCYEVLKEYSKKSVVISYFIQKKTSMKLPDLIICPFNRFNLSYLQEMNISEPLSQYLELTYPTIMYHRFQLLRAEEIMVNSDLYDEQLQSILRQNNLNFSDFIQRASLNCPAFFPLRECTEDDDENCINPCSEATEMYTSAGRCFRFPSSIQNASGYGHGYSIIVNLPYELYHTGVNQILNDGILVKLVGDGKGVNYDMSLIPAGVHAIIPLTATRYDFMNDPPRYECEEDPLDTYSSLHCFESCVHHGIAEDKCKCSLVASVNPKRYDICTAKVIRACVIPEFYNPDQHLQVEKCNIKCKPPCKSWAFTKQLSYAPLSTNMVRD